MTAIARPAGLFPPLATGTPLLGEIITWTCAGVSVKYPDLIAALKEAGLDESVARELAPRHAFTRACRKLNDQRIIRQVAEDEASVRFQFTAEHRDGDRYEYELETMLVLDKKTGKVSCDLAGLATLAQEELDRCIGVRTGADLTRVVQRLFERQADLFPIRPQGGAYFCPIAHAPLVDRVQGLLGKLNGQVLRFPVPAGTPHGDRSVKEAVTSGLSALVAEHAAAVESFGSDTRSDTLERAAERIRQARFKVEAYSAYLAGETGKLDDALSAAAARLREKVAQIAADREAVTSTAPSLV
ncbi:MAG TPA: DUF6744 family protein [Gemmataceae bacterium]|nr:DUF6744 family protein [Gemmataceae bacterium]